MKDLLQAIQTELRTALHGYCRSSDVYVTPDENLLPEGAMFPAVGLKDGQIRRRELAGGMMAETLDASIIIVQGSVRTIEAAVIGDASTKGVLEIAAVIHEALDENLLGLAGMISAVCLAESASQTYLSETDSIQVKILTYTYEREAERP